MDWTAIDRSLGEVYHLTPLECDELTLAEIAVLLDTKGKLGQRRNRSDDEIRSGALRWASLTHRQRLEQRLLRD